MYCLLNRNEFPFLSYTWGLKKGPLSGGARIGHHRKFPPPLPPSGIRAEPIENCCIEGPSRAQNAKAVGFNFLSRQKQTFLSGNERGETSVYRLQFPFQVIFLAVGENVWKFKIKKDLSSEHN